MKRKERTPGRELPSVASYGFEDILTHFEKGDNRLRTERLAQPAALIKGDNFVTGEHVVSNPREADKDGVFVQLSNGIESGYWIYLPLCIPIALRSPENRIKGKFSRAINLAQGDVLATGAILLSDPYVIEGGSVSLKFSGKDKDYTVRLFSSVPIALLTQDDSAPNELWSV